MLIIFLLLSFIEFCTAYISFSGPGVIPRSRHNFELNIRDQTNTIQVFIKSNSFSSRSSIVNVTLTCETSGVLLGDTAFSFTRTRNDLVPFSIELSKITRLATIIARVSDRDTRTQRLTLFRASSTLPQRAGDSQLTSSTRISGNSTIIPSAAPNSQGPSAFHPVPSPRPATPGPAPVAPVSTPNPSVSPAAAPTGSSPANATHSTAPSTLQGPSSVPIAATSQPATVPVPSLPSSSLAYQPGENKDLYAIVVLLNWAGHSSSVDTVAKAESVLFNSPTSVAANLENAFSTCSYGKVSFKRENVFVFTASFAPASGPAGAILAPVLSSDAATYLQREMGFSLTNALPIDINRRFGTAEGLFAQYLTIGLALTNHANDPQLQRILQQSQIRVVTILDNLPVANPEGVGIMHCPEKFCRVQTYRGTGGQLATSLLHEFSHTLGSTHAESSVTGYLDCNDPMGCSAGTQGLTCHNAAQAYRLGWASQIDSGVISASSFSSSRTLTFNIPAARLTSKNHVKFTIGGGEYYIDFRSRSPTASGFDGELGAGSDKVFVNRYDFGQTLDYQLRDSNTVAALSNGQNWQVTDSGRTYAVAVRSIAADTANIEITQL